MRKVDHAILGGGLAGLCAARRLIELNCQPLVIEAGSYPAHKVCGEFLSPSSLPTLERWEIYPEPLYQAHIHTPANSYQFSFPTPAGGLSHLTLDFQLAQYISKKGILLTETKVQQISFAKNEADFHTLLLSSGETILTKHLFIATGRLSPSSQKPRMPYIGLKAHFTGIDLGSTLHMFSFEGAYLGVMPIENQRANLACLAHIDKIRSFSSPQKFMQKLLASHPLLNQLLASGSNLFDNWMETHVPVFGLRTTPEQVRTYWIGDASNTIPPACGNGLSLAIKSGCLAAEFAVRDDALGFKRAWRQYCSSRILFGKGLHHLFLHPILGNTALSLSRRFPLLAQKIFEWTR